MLKNFRNNGLPIVFSAFCSLANRPGLFRPKEYKNSPGTMLHLSQWPNTLAPVIFFQSTFENRESEFYQWRYCRANYFPWTKRIFTIKKFEGDDGVDSEPSFQTGKASSFVYLP